MKTVNFYLNCNSDPINADVVNENNENNFNLNVEGELHFNVVRKENHNANELPQGFLSYFTE